MAVGLLGSWAEAIVTALLGRVGAERLRAQIAFHLRVLDTLPPDSPLRGEIEGHVEHLVRSLVAIETAQLHRKRDWGQIVVALFFVALVAFGTWEAARAGGWWWFAA